jgi:hypothetical protein
VRAANSAPYYWFVNLADLPVYLLYTGTGSVTPRWDVTRLLVTELLGDDAELGSAGRSDGWPIMLWQHLVPVERSGGGGIVLLARRRGRRKREAGSWYTGDSYGWLRIMLHAVSCRGKLASKPSIKPWRAEPYRRGGDILSKIEFRRSGRKGPFPSVSEGTNDDQRVGVIEFCGKLRFFFALVVPAT